MAEIHWKHFSWLTNTVVNRTSNQKGIEGRLARLEMIDTLRHMMVLNLSAVNYAIGHAETFEAALALAKDFETVKTVRRSGATRKDVTQIDGIPHAWLVEQLELNRENEKMWNDRVDYLYSLLRGSEHFDIVAVQHKERERLLRRAYRNELNPGNKPGRAGSKRAARKRIAARETKNG